IPVPRLSCHDRIAEQRTKGAGEHVGILVLAMMAVQRRGQHARLQRMMNDRKEATGLRSVDFPMCFVSAKVELLSRIHLNDGWSRRRGWPRRFLFHVARSLFAQEE